MAMWKQEDLGVDVVVELQFPYEDARLENVFSSNNCIFATFMRQLLFVKIMSCKATIKIPN